VFFDIDKLTISEDTIYKKKLSELNIDKSVDQIIFIQEFYAIYV